MYAAFSPAFWLHFLREFRCPYCGSLEGHVSRPRTFFERHALKCLRLRPARCGECYRRCYVPKRMPLEPHPKALNFDPEKMLASTLAAENKASAKETSPDPGPGQPIA